MKSSQRVPEMRAEQGLQRFRWVGAEHDFGYPLEVSSSLYRAPEMAQLFSHLAFRNPNEQKVTERSKQSRSGRLWAKAGACRDIIASSGPIGEGRSAGALAKRYAAGERLRIDAYRDFISDACHQEVALQFESTYVSKVA